MLPSFGVIGSLLVEFALNCVKQRPIEYGCLLSRENLAPISDLPDIKAVAQESGDRGPRVNEMPPMVRPLDSGRILVFTPVVRRSASRRLRLPSSR